MKQIALVLIKVIACLLAFFAFILVFVGGIFSSNTKMEKIANYASEIVLNNTEKHEFCALSVEGTSDSGQILDSQTEFLNLYGAFKESIVTFASVVNCDKKQNIKISGGVSKNLSILYGGANGSFEYHDHYIHSTFPIELMFKTRNYYELTQFFAFISQTHADNILAEKGATRDIEGNYSIEQYQSLQGQLISVDIDGEFYDFAITDIYYEDTYYCKGLNDVIGDFIMCSYYLPDNIQKNRANLYFLNDNAYQNKYLMTYINNAYPSKNYNLQLVKNNIIGEVDADYLTSFYYSDIKNIDWLCTIFMVLSVLLLIASLFLCFVNKSNGIIFYLSLSLVSILPYLVFDLVYHISHEISIFSAKSTKFFTSIVIFYFLAVILVGFIKKTRALSKFSDKNGDVYGEIFI